MSPGRKPEYLLGLINQAVIRLLMLYFYLSQTCIIPPLRVAACRIYNRTPERERERERLCFSFLLFLRQKKKYYNVCWPFRRGTRCVSHLLNTVEPHSSWLEPKVLIGMWLPVMSHHGKCWVFFSVTDCVQTHGSNRWQHCSFFTRTGYLAICQWGRGASTNPQK